MTEEKRYLESEASRLAEEFKLTTEQAGPMAKPPEPVIERNAWRRPYHWTMGTPTALNSKLDQQIEDFASNIADAYKFNNAQKLYEQVEQQLTFAKTELPKNEQLDYLVRSWAVIKNIRPSAVNEQFYKVCGPDPVKRQASLEYLMKSVIETFKLAGQSVGQIAKPPADTPISPDSFYVHGPIRPQ